MSTYKSLRSGSSETVALDNGRRQRLGDIWLALLVGFLSVGLSTWVWMNNDDIVAWGMSQGMVGEGSIGTLLGVVRRAAMVSAVLGLGAAGLMVRPVRMGVTTIVRSLARIVRAAYKAASSGLHGLWLAFVAVQRYVWRGITGAARMATVPLGLLWRGLVAIAHASALPLSYLWRGLSAVVGAVVLVLVLMWLGGALVARMVGRTLRWLGTGLAKVLALTASVLAQVLALVLGYIGQGLTAGLGYLRLAATPIAGAISLAATVMWLATAAVTRRMALAVVSLGRVVLSILVLGVMAVPLAVVRATGYGERGARAGTGYVRVAIAPVSKTTAHVLTATRLGSATVARALTSVLQLLALGWVRALVLGVAAVARVVALLLGYAWRGVTVLAHAMGQALRYVWLGVVAVSRIAARLLGYAWIGSVAVSRTGGRLMGYVWASVVVIARVAALVLRHFWRGVVAITRVTTLTLWISARVLARAVGLVLEYVWRGVVAVSRVVARLLGLATKVVAQAAGTGLRYVWIGIVAVSRTVTQLLRYVWIGVVAVSRMVAWLLGYVWIGVVAVARIVARLLGYVWLGVLAVARIVARLLGYVRIGVVAITRIVGRLMVYVWLGLVAIARVVGRLLGYAWIGLAAVARVVAQVLRYVRLSGAVIVLAVARLVGFASKILARTASLMLGYLRLWVVAIARAVASAVAHATVSLLLTIAVVLLHALSGLYTGLTYIGLGLGTAALVGARAARYAWMPIATALGYIGASLITLAGALFRLLRLVVATLGSPLLVGSTVILHFMWLGVSKTARAAGWMIRTLSIGTAMILVMLIRTPGFLLRTAGTGLATSPDVFRAVVWSIRREKGGTEMSDTNLTRERLLPFVMTVLVFFTIGAATVRVLWPAPPEPTVEVVHWATGHLFRDDLLPDMAAAFNERGHRSKSGTRIVVKVVNDPSSLQADDLLSRVTGGGRQEAVCCPASDTPHPDPTIVTPSSAHWLVRVNHEAGRRVVDPDAARPIARAYIGIITYRDMAECLGWPAKEIGYGDLIELRRDPRGWQKYDCAKPSWGPRPLVAFTDPRTSSTGRSVLLALFAMAADKQPEELELSDIESSEVLGRVREFQGLIDHYFIGTTVMNTKIYQGPSFGQFFVMPEDNLIHLHEGTKKAHFGGVKKKAPPIHPGKMVMIYPKEGSMARNNCACIVTAPWVTPEHVEGAEKWIDFIREDEQQRAFMRAGFRPVTDLPLTDPNSKITSEYGLTPSTPKKQMDVALIDPAVANAIDESWETVKRPGIVTFVVDTSGSMLGGKLKQAKDGLIRALDSMAENNQVGFVSFDDTINTHIPVAPIAESGFAIADAVNKLRARGETALYEAIKTGIEMTDAAVGAEEAIRGVVVLTDGRANRCNVRLHDLIKMESSIEEAKIPIFGGCENDPPAVDDAGRRVEKVDMIGAEPAIDTVHDIQVFFIGIGDDADLEVGRMLAEATGAEFQGVSEDDLANVLEEFSGYF